MELLTPDQFAERLPRATAWWVRKQLTAGNIRGSKVGARWYIPADALPELIARTSNQAAI